MAINLLFLNRTKKVKLKENKCLNYLYYVTIEKSIFESES